MKDYYLYLHVSAATKVTELLGTIFVDIEKLFEEHVITRNAPLSNIYLHMSYIRQKMAIFHMEFLIKHQAFSFSICLFQIKNHYFVVTETHM